MALPLPWGARDRTKYWDERIGSSDDQCLHRDTGAGSGVIATN